MNNERNTAKSAQLTIDPRVTRTTERLTESLFHLITRRRWDKIRVQDILEHAGVSRSAFYAHYDNKYDLLTASIPELFLSLSTPGVQGPDLLPLFEHVDEAAAVMRPLMNQSISADILDSFHRNMRDAWTMYLVDIGREDASGLLAEFLAGSLLAVMRAYASKDDREAPATVARTFQALVQKLLT